MTTVDEGILTKMITQKTIPCQHYEIISTPAPGKHIMERCIHCGRIVDYSELQQQYPILYNDSLLNREVNMERIMADRNNGGKRKKGRPSKYSRGRVR